MRLANALVAHFDVGLNTGFVTLPVLTSIVPVTDPSGVCDSIVRISLENSHLADVRFEVIVIPNSDPHACSVSYVFNAVVSSK